MKLSFLSIISFAYKIAGVSFALVSLGFLVTFLQVKDAGFTPIFWDTVTWLVSFLLISISCLAIAELIGVFQQIESNTRRTADALESLKSKRKS